MRPAATAGRLAIALGALAVLPFPAAAGGEPPDAATRVEVLRRDLRSPDAATVAWAAYRAGGEDLRDLVPDLVRCFDDRPHSLVVGHLLDALIRLDAKVPLGVLIRHEARFQTSVLVLAVRHGEEAHPLLRRILAREIRGRTIHAAGVAAGNVLAAAKDPEAAASFVGRIEPEVWVTVVDHDRLHGGGRHFAVVHGDAVGEATEGFPPTVWYDLDFRRTEGAESRLVARGPTKDVWWTRRESARRRFIVGDLSDRGDATEIGLGWVASLLGERVDALPLRETYHAPDHRWSGAAAYVAFIEAHRRAVGRDAGALLDRLLAAGMLQASERRALTIRPRFLVEDARDRRDESLPTLDDAAPR